MARRGLARLAQVGSGVAWLGLAVPARCGGVGPVLARLGSAIKVVGAADVFMSRYPILPLPPREPVGAAQERKDGARPPKPEGASAPDGAEKGSVEAVCSKCSKPFTVVRKPGARPTRCEACRKPKRASERHSVPVRNTAEPEARAAKPERPQVMVLDPEPDPERPLFVPREHAVGPRSSDPAALRPPPAGPWENAGQS
jgi:hypothetical protein